MANEYTKTTRRTLTRRSVLWLGQTCNLRCRFCYFLDRIADKEHPEHPFMSFEKAARICSTIRDTHGDNAVDIQGGEPVIYPQIHELSEHCHRIGLLPTLITNAVPLNKREPCQRLKDAGVRDLLISIHGLGEAYDTIVGVPNASAKQLEALDHLIAVDMPFRFNCVLASSVLPHLEGVARLAVQSGAWVVNFIAFNPFEDQEQNRRSTQDVPRYEEAAAALTPALDILEAADVEYNVRYFPFCMLQERHRPGCYNFQQLSYDPHEWNFDSWTWTGMQPQRMRDGELTAITRLREANTWSRRYGQDPQAYINDPTITPEDERRHNAIIRASEHTRCQHPPACGTCDLQPICDGFHGDYAEIFGGEAEARPVSLEGGRTDDPIHYARLQRKVVESEDYDWAL